VTLVLHHRYDRVSTMYSAVGLTVYQERTPGHPGVAFVPLFTAQGSPHSAAVRWTLGPLHGVLFFSVIRLHRPFRHSQASGYGSSTATYTLTSGDALIPFTAGFAVTCITILHDGFKACTRLGHDWENRRIGAAKSLAKPHN
jgi:hypothetical protein